MLITCNNQINAWYIIPIIVFALYIVWLMLINRLFYNLRNFEAIESQE